jgi:pimeloyl-ACP methyl ester carboxylesterase
MKLAPLMLAVLLWHLPAAGATPGVELSRCQLSAAKGLLRQPAECGSLTVAENPEDSAGRQIPIHFAVLKTTASNPEPDPVFYFAGGPGQSALESFPAALGALREVRANRDVVLVDQRGTGGSNPLTCPMPEEISELLRTPSHQEIERDALACLQQLDGDTRFYTTGHAAADVDQVRQALGYDRINLYGISYGTRLAQVFLRHYPDAVRSVILDGVVPTDLVLGTEHAINLEAALLSVFRRCALEPSCDAAFPRVEEKFEQLKRAVTEHSVSLVVPMPLSGTQQELVFNRDMLAVALRILAYSPESQAILPLLVFEAATESRYQRLAAMALMILESLGESIYRGLEASVMCAEDVPHFPSASQDPDTLMGDVLITAAREQCARWPHGSAPDDFHTPFSSDVPVLLLSGEHDPVTPPHYGEQALKQYRHGLHLVVPGQAHGVAGRGCLPKIIGRFVKAGSVEALQTECVEEGGDAPFFTTLLGSAP